jgi:integrase/recombinase XerD
MNKLNEDVSEFVDSPKIRKTLPNVLDSKDIDKIMTISLNNPFDYRNKAMLELIYGAGLRVSELISLTLYSVDLENCVIRITGKGRKERIIPIGEYIIDSLKDYLEIRSSLIKKGKKETDLLFLNNHGEPITRQGFNLILKKILSQKGINGKITPHTLRHSFATHMIDNGSDIRIVQELLGHSNIETTKIYTHISREKINDDYKKFHPRNNL